MLGMPTHYLRSLSGQQRRADLNLNLARYLTFVAGAANAGGFLAVQQYTSHMSGIVASIGSNLALGHHQLVLGSLLALLSFLAGAACTAIMVNWGKRKRLHSLFALPLVLESLLLIGFGLVGSSITTVMLLCFLMGLQNALITKISKTEIRTTHVTGIVTDIGIELGKLIYWNDQSLRQNASTLFVTFAFFTRRHRGRLWLSKSRRPVYHSTGGALVSASHRPRMGRHHSQLYPST
jgi:uncharacterized membrane protein YoaK (UPF0700 family)